MIPRRVLGSVCALVLLGAWAGPVFADNVEATEVCWRRCHSSAVSCAPPCGPQVCHYEAPWYVGPVRRWLGWYRPVLVCQPACPPPCASCAPPPCTSCAPAVVVSPPAPVVVPPPAVAPAAPAPPPGPAIAPEPPRFPPDAGSSYRPTPLPARVPAQPLTPPQPVTPVRLDRFVSYPGN